MIQKLSLFAALCISIAFTTEAKTVRALFIGNSYTASNDLPNLVSRLATSTGDTLIYESVTPGGYRFQQHATLAETRTKIQAGNWDYVILQEQSQLPAFGDAQVAAQVYPYARMLDSMVKEYNPCASTLFYMTWGRKYGDVDNCPYMPVLCTYEGMDSLLQLRYTIMAENNQAAITPVARLWRALRTEHPSIDLYVSDNSHPSIAGSYAAACAFYTMMFHKEATDATYNATLTESVANIIKVKSKQIVYDSLYHWNRFEDDYVHAAFQYAIDEMNIVLTNESINGDSYLWDFGDGNTSIEEHPTHNYDNPGTYDITLTVLKDGCDQSQQITQTITVFPTSSISPILDKSSVEIAPNPAYNFINITMNKAYKQVYITDIYGRKLYVADLNQEKIFQINISALQSGYYWLHAIDDHHTKVVSTFIKK